MLLKKTNGGSKTAAHRGLIQQSTVLHETKPITGILEVCDGLWCFFLTKDPCQLRINFHSSNSSSPSSLPIFKLSLVRLKQSKCC